MSRRRFIRNTAAVGLALPALGRIARAAELGPPPPGGRWLAGDLHVHTIFSHDVWGGPTDDNTGPDEAYTLGWTAAEQIAIAEARLLDFLAITDHNDVRALADPLYTSALLTLIPGYEHSLSHGHAGCLGIDEVLAISTSDDAGALDLRDEVHARGGTFILNHPFYGSGWGYSNLVRPDSIEVWNIAWPYRKEIFGPIIDKTSENYKSLPYWENDFLSGGPMPATGGSDNHWRSTVSVQGAGQPCTWVFAADKSWQAILEGIKAGRTFVAAEPPGLGGARVELTAEKGTQCWMVGDTVPSSTGPASVIAHVQNAPGHLLRFVVDGVYGDPIQLTRPDESVAVTVDAGAHRRVRAEVYLPEVTLADVTFDSSYWMTALTSPIYFG
jgi:hypothetical protein